MKGRWYQANGFCCISSRKCLVAKWRGRQSRFSKQKDIKHSSGKKWIYWDTSVWSKSVANLLYRYSRYFKWLIWVSLEFILCRDLRTQCANHTGPTQNSLSKTLCTHICYYPIVSPVAVSQYYRSFLPQRKGKSSHDEIVGVLDERPSKLRLIT